MELRMHSRMVWMKFLVISALLLGVGGTSLAQTPSYERPPQRIRPTLPGADLELEAARMLLSGYHAVPTQKDLEATFSNARELMMRIASDKNEFELHRQRAVAALGYWSDMSVYAVYSKLLHAADTSDGLKHQIIGHLARVFGEVGVADAAAFLGHEDVQYRLTAVHVLGQVDSDAAQKYLNAAAATEKNEVVLERISRFTMQVR